MCVPGMQASGLSHAGGVDGTWGSILDGLAGCVAGVALTRTHVGGGTESVRRSLANAPASPPAAAAGGGGQPAGIRDAWLGALGRQRRASSDADDRNPTCVVCVSCILVLDYSTLRVIPALGCVARERARRAQ